MLTFLISLEKKTNNKKGKQTNKVNNNKSKKKLKTSLDSFSLRCYVVTRYAVTRFTNNHRNIAHQCTFELKKYRAAKICFL